MQIKFDRPVSPDQVELIDIGHTGLFERAIALPARSLPDGRSLEIPVLFPRLGQTVRVEVRDAGGSFAPIAVEYEVDDQVHTPEQLAQLTTAGNSEPLKNIVTQVRARRRDLRSVVETVRDVSMQTVQPVWLQRLEAQPQARFAWQQPSQFLADVSEYMRSAVMIVGGDETQCWNRVSDIFVIGPTESIDAKNIVICDPFHAMSGQTDGEVIGKLRLEFVGDENFRGVTCHRVRSWREQVNSREQKVDKVCLDWLFDGETLLPVLCESFSVYGPMRDEFVYDSVDVPLPAEMFQPPRDTGIVPVELEPLGEGYDRRFLNAIDASTGRMSVRWGKVGPGGRSSSGLN
jgi:hypothetical protein